MKALCILVMLVISTYCYAQTTGTTAIAFSETDFNFGKIKEGKRVVHSFKFKNAGSSDLIITQAIASCGCTVAKFSEKPVAPNKQGAIKVIFNGERKGMGANEVAKTVTILANTQPNATTLTLHGIVKPKE